MTHRYRKGVTILNLKNGSQEIDRQYGLGRFSEFSNFSFLYSPEFNSHRPLQRIFSLARRAECDLLVFELIRLYPEDMVASVQSFSDADEPNAIRISFLKLRKNPQSEAVSPTNYTMVGYVVFLRGSGSFRDDPGQVYEAVLDPCWKTKNNGPFVHCAKEYKIETAVGTFSVRGVLYTQQNKHTTFCLHAAMRTALSCVLPEQDIEYRKIIKAVGERQSSKNEKGGGSANDDYSVRELVELINKLGSIDCIPIQMEQNSEFFYRVLYEWIECGIPVILSYHYQNEQAVQEGHAVTLIGHTFDDHIWAPAANQLYFPGNGISREYSSSESYANAFVLHDDNCGPYLTLPKNYFNSERFFAGNTRPILFGLARKRMALYGEDAESLAHRSLETLFLSLEIPQDRSWLSILHRHFQLNRLVLRPLKISHEKYLAYLREKVGIEEANLSKIDGEIARSSYWMIEISCQELFGITKQKFGEILLWDADVNESNRESVRDIFVMARLPQAIFFDLDGKLVLHTDVASYTPLISSSQYL